MKLIIINGPNLNLLGTRETNVYGNQPFEDYFEALAKRFSSIELHYYQSNVEGELINKLHETGFSFDGIIINWPWCFSLQRCFWMGICSCRNRFFSQRLGV